MKGGQDEGREKVMDWITAGIDWGVSGMVGFLVKAVLMLIVLVAILLVRQVNLMNRVVNVSVNGGFRILAWAYLLIAVAMTAIVILV